MSRVLLAAPVACACRLGDGFVSEQRFAVEFNGRVVGLAVRISGGFAFHSSDPRFKSLDGKLFPRAKEIIQRLRNPSNRRGATAIGETW